MDVWFYVFCGRKFFIVDIIRKERMGELRARQGVGAGAGAGVSTLLFITLIIFHEASDYFCSL